MSTAPMPSGGEPDPSSVSPLLGTNRLQSAVDHLVSGLNKGADRLTSAADRLSKIAQAVNSTSGGVGNPSTLGGGKPLGGGSAPVIGPRLNQWGTNGTSGKLPVPPIGPVQQRTTAPTPPAPPTRAQKWGAYGTGVGAVWGSHAMAQFLSGADERLSTNTTAQLMSRSSNMGAFQIRSLLARGNTTAVSDTDAMQAGVNLQRSGYAIGTSGYNSLLNLTKNYNVVDPTATADQASARLTAFSGSVANQNFLYSRGIRSTNVGGGAANPNAVMDQMIGRLKYGNVKWNQNNIAATWQAGGSAERMVSTVSQSMGADAGQALADRIHSMQQAGSHGMTLDAYTKAVGSKDWNTLKKHGFTPTDLDSLKTKEAAKRDVTDNTAAGFSKGLQDANDALTKFNKALDTITQGNLGKLIGMTQGVAGASGLASTLLQTGSGIAGSMIGSAIGSRLGGGLAGKALGSLGSKVAGSAAGKALGSAGSKVMGTAAGKALGGAAAKIGLKVTAKGLMKGGLVGAAASTVGDLAGAVVSDGHHGVRDQFGGVLSSAGTGAAIGATIGSVIPVLGTGVGALIGGGAGAIVGALTNQSADGQGGVAAEGNAGGPSVGGSKTGAATATSGIAPVSGFKISAPFGHYSNGKPHHGVDFACPIGTPVRANRSGKVIKAGWDNGGFGNHVRIDSGDGLIEIYGHMSRVNVKQGDTVQAGQLLGLSGDTGNVTGPHLHFEVRKGGAGIGNAVDPMPYVNGSGGVSPGTPADVSGSVAAGANGQTTSSSSGQRGAGSGVPWGINEAELVASGLSANAGPGPGGKPGGDSPSSGSTGAATTPASGATGPLRSILAKAGFTGGGLAMAYAIMMAESHGNAHAHNTNARTGDNSYGLFQINMLGGMGPERRAHYHLANNDALFDPLTNAKVAFDMSGGGRNWTPWSTYKRGDYKQYLGGQTKSYDVGSTNIDVDQIARVHKGEMIIDPVTADELRKALSSNTPTSILGGKGKGGGSVHIEKIEITTAHSFTDSAATDLAKQTLAIIANHTNQQNLREG